MASVKRPLRGGFNPARNVSTAAIVAMLALVCVAPVNAPRATAAPLAQLFSQHAYLKASNTDHGDSFGSAIAISSDTVVVGAIGEQSSAGGINGDGTDDSFNDAGAAYVFIRSGTEWSQQAYLKASNPAPFDHFGFAVALSGDTIVVGAPNRAGGGAAYVFVRNDKAWTEQAILRASTTEALDGFAASVAISGETVVVGAPGEDSAATGVNGNETDETAADAGAAYVFTRAAGLWTQQAYLKASNAGAGDEFGQSVAIDGDLAAVGAYFEDSAQPGNEVDNSAANAGAVYLFSRSAGVWSHDAYLKASEPDSNDLFGASVAVSGGTVVVGGNGEDSAARAINGDATDDSASSAGAAWVFTSSGAGWVEEAYLKASNADAGDEFGRRVAIDTDTIVVGAHFEDGSATGINGNRSSDSASWAGAAYVFARSDGSWQETAYVKASNTDASDQFGFSVGVDGDLVAVGAWVEASAATGVGGDGSDDSAYGAGSAYIFGPPCATAPFVDVVPNQAFCAEIEWMKQTGISTGFPGGLYKPSQAVTRQAMSAFMARLAGAALPDCTTAPFSDVNPDHPFCREIQWMRDANISTGFDDGTYRPNIAVTRQAMSAFMTRLAGANPPACVEPPFSDVPVDHPFCEEIAWMKDSGISTGFNDGTYRPVLEVTRQAMSAFMYRLAGLLPVT